MGLRDRIPLRIDFDEIPHPDGPVLVFHIPFPVPSASPLRTRESTGAGMGIASCP